jgi:hypothetical protein
MSVEIYPDQLEPEDQNAVIWRFMDLPKFRDLMTSSELYFCRADLLNDTHEGLPPQEYLATWGLHPLDIWDRRELTNTIGSDAQFREGFYVSCWHLFSSETYKMWKEYGQGVAVASRYSMLKSALNVMSDRAYLGMIRYGPTRLIGERANIFRYITTKRWQYAEEREVRAFLWIMDPHAGINRHIDEHNNVHPMPLTPPPPEVLKGHRRKVELQSLLTKVIVSPWATSASFGEVSHWVKSLGYSIPVEMSELSRYKLVLPEP